MTIDAKMSASELLRFREVLWTPNFWLNLFNHVCWRDLGFFWIMLYVLFATIVCEYVQQPWRLLLVILFTLTAIATVGGRIRRKLRLNSQEVARINRDLPLSYMFDEQGVAILDDKGITSLVPWQLFVHWQDAGSVLIANFGSANKDLILPCEQLPPIKAAMLRAILQMHIGAPLPLASRGSVRLLRS